MDELFVQALPILHTLEKHGFEAVFVGGSVRDALLGRPIHDVDIATSATPDEVKAIFKKTVDVGIEHGTVLVLEQGGAYEITTFRVESEYVDYRKPKEVKFIRSLDDDLQRRDFTMNAIAMKANGELIDPFDGQAAIKERLIDTVGEANDRFSEDALRMMRALRFVSQLSFSCSPRTLEALMENQALLQNISIERITAEFEKLLQGRNVKQAFQFILTTNLFIYLPGFKGCKESLEKVVQYPLFPQLSLDEKWAFLLFHVSTLEETDTFLRSWRLPVKRIRAIKQILQAVDNGKLDDRFTLFQTGLECSQSAMKLQCLLNQQNWQDEVEKLTALWESLPIQNLSDVTVNGKMLMEWSDRKQGPWIKDVLNSIAEKIVKGELSNHPDAINKEVQRCNQI